MSNLFKIKNLCKSLAKEFGDTTEGQGYHMLYTMLDKEEKSTPTTIQDLYRSIYEKLIEKGIERRFSLDIDIYDPQTIRYKTYFPGDSVEASSPKLFYEAVIKSIEKNTDKLLLEQVEIKSKNNIAL